MYDIVLNNVKFGLHFFENNLLAKLNINPNNDQLWVFIALGEPYLMLGLVDILMNNFSFFFCQV